MLERVTKKHLDDIFALYKELYGYKGCTWDESYPTIDMLAEDIENGYSYCIMLGSKPVAVAVIEPDDWMTELNWQKKSENPAALSRVCVKKSEHGKGLGKQIVKLSMQKAKELGYDSIRLLVGRKNKPAIKLYESLGFSCGGETDIFDEEWFYMEKPL